MAKELSDLARVSGETLIQMVTAHPGSKEETLKILVDDLDARLVDIRKEGLTARFDIKRLVQVFSFYNGLKYFAEDILSEAEFESRIKKDHELILAQGRKEAEFKAREEAKRKLRLEKQEAEQKAKVEAEAKAQAAAEEKARLAAAAKAKREAEYKAKLEAEQKAAKEKARLEAEAKARIESYIKDKFILTILDNTNLRTAPDKNALIVAKVNSNVSYKVTWIIPDKQNVPWYQVAITSGTGNISAYVISTLAKLMTEQELWLFLERLWEKERATQVTGVIDYTDFQMQPVGDYIRGHALLPKDYDKRVIGIDKFLKSGPPDEVYKVAGFDQQSLKDKIIKATG